jgi:hypothetical protein
VARITRRAQSANAATGVNLSDNALAHKFRRTRRALQHPYKLVTECASEASIAAHDLDISITDAAQRHTHHGLALIARPRNISHRHTAILITQGEHKILKKSDE